MSLFIESMSERRGTPCRRVGPSARRQAATIGSEEFLLPEISILPLRRVPPRMRKLSAMLALPWPGIGPKCAGGRAVASRGNHATHERPPYVGRAGLVHH